MSFARKLQRRQAGKPHDHDEPRDASDPSDAAAEAIVTFLLHHPVPTALVKACLRSHPVSKGPVGLCLTFVHRDAAVWWRSLVQPMAEEDRIYKSGDYHAGRVLTVDELEKMAPHLKGTIRAEVKAAMRNRPHMRSTALIVHGDGEVEFQHWEMLTVERGPVAEDLDHGDNTGFVD